MFTFVTKELAKTGKEFHYSLVLAVLHMHSQAKKIPEFWRVGESSIEMSLATLNSIEKAKFKDRPCI